MEPGLPRSRADAARAVPLIATIEFLPNVRGTLRPELTETLAQVVIARQNEDVGPDNRGDYEVALRDASGDVLAKGMVLGFDRERGASALVGAALDVLTRERS